MEKIDGARRDQCLSVSARLYKFGRK